MVQQLSLVATFNKHEFNLIINTFVALTGQKPQILATENTIYRPLINLKYFQNKQSINNSLNLNQVEQFLIRISRAWSIYREDGAKKNPNLIVNEILANDNSRFVEKVNQGEISLGEISLGQQSASNSNSSRTSGEEPAHEYTFQICDIPAAGKRKVSSQTIYESNIVQTWPGLNNYLLNLGYTKKQKYLVKGLKFLYNGTINVEIFQIFSVGASNTGSSNSNETPKMQSKTQSDPTVKILDESENWFLKIYSNVAKITDVGMINKATNDLLVLQKELNGLVKLKIPERNFMDSRVSDTT